MFKRNNVEEWESFLLIYKFGVNEVITKLEILNSEYSNAHEYNPIEHIKYRVKTHKSIIDKLGRLNFEPTIENAKNHLTDLGGIRVICAFEDDVYKLFKTFSKVKNIDVIQVKDYIKNPKPNGYRSFHAIISVPVFLSKGVTKVVIELQIRTIVMDFWASLEHKLYYKKDIEIPFNISSGLKDCASISGILDEKMLSIKKQINDLNQ
ncbi:MAG: GTP pyrophosphokinase [Oscillospiraceae bacterium]